MELPVINTSLLCLHMMCIYSLLYSLALALFFDYMISYGNPVIATHMYYSVSFQPDTISYNTSLLYDGTMQVVYSTLLSGSYNFILACGADEVSTTSYPFTIIGICYLSRKICINL